MKRLTSDNMNEYGIGDAVLLSDGRKAIITKRGIYEGQFWCEVADATGINLPKKTGMGRFLTYMVEGRRQTIRLIDAEPIEQALFKQADKSLAKNPYDNTRICAFRKALDLILNAPTITPPPNDPLTLEELREMDGEPVWVVELNGYPPHWGLVYWCRKSKRNIVYVTTNNGASICAEAFLTVGGKIYRRRPEEGMA